MPVYTYECPDEHTTEQYRPLADWSVTATCSCGLEAYLVIQPVAVHTLATFSADIDDRAVQATRDPGDGSYFDPNLFDRKTGKHPRIKSAKHREQVMRDLGVTEIPPSDMAKDVMRDKRRQAKTFSGVGSRA